MPWVLVDILIGLVALLILGAVGFSGYRHVRSLLRTAKDAGSRIGAVTAQLDALQSESPKRNTP